MLPEKFSYYNGMRNHGNGKGKGNLGMKNQYTKS